MEALVEQAMREGAFGLSAGLFYVPGNYTPTEELVTLARAVARFGGIYIAHIRDEAAGVVESVNETIRIGEEARLPVQVTHHKIIGRANWGKSAETLRRIEEARTQGVDVTVDQYPYTATSTGTAALFPQWAQEGGQAELVKRLQDPALRGRIRKEVAYRILHDRGAGDPANVVMAYCGFDPSLAGKDLARITRERGREVTAETAAETAVEIQMEGGCSAIYHAVSEEDVERILRAPFTMVASDGEIPAFGRGAPHPRSYGTFARVLARYVRERKLLGFEEAVRRMSSLPAARLGLWDRGLLRPGMKADLALLDPEAVADRATFQEPHQYAAGVRHVLVNGKAVLLEGAMTQERPGRVLYGPGYPSGRPDRQAGPTSRR
jgi:dihydroorotase/N-acyl-D-amino-acid deacylase